MQSAMEALANEYLAKLKSIYPSGYSQLRDESRLAGYKKEFILAVVQNKITTREMLDIGIARAREDSKKNPFMPPPHKFADWCRTQPEDIGLPSSLKAYRIASTESGKRADIREWSNPVIYVTAREVGFFDLANEQESKIFKYFQEVYADNCKKALQGYEFEIPKTQRVEHKPITTAQRNKELALSELDSIRDLLEK
ncbi:replication protein P [Sessilibacter corallicola]|uniref:replication protein P n=1 Tax=Sessilibacter corallicola TaxID=2904075 RepID=UPI001E5D65C8|nr:replication protein P [Sessilibacter corallicola]MCE2029267.1 hypothetical protein [Sessilibacter corallicola]